jgi:uncharacterized protein
VPHPSIRLVLDTNVLLQGLVRRHSPAGILLRKVEERQFLLLLSSPVLTEYQAVLTDEEITARFPDLTRQRVNDVLRHLWYFGDRIRRVTARFEYPRAPSDEKLIELAIDGNATHILSFDKDLLSLSTEHGEAANRFRQRLPGVEVMRPLEFMRERAQPQS